MKMKIFYCFVVIAFAAVSYAASPSWVVTTFKNLRRAVQTAAKAKNGVTAAIAIGKCEHALSEAQINDLANAALRSKGLETVGKELGKLNLVGKYGDDVGHLVLQDTYLRIALRNGKITSELAEATMKHMGGTPGLTALLRKINSLNPAVVKGHLRELEIGLRSSERGFKVVSFGQKFSDGLKKADTDLDVFIATGDGAKRFAIESKAYIGAVPNDMVRADAESLLAFCKGIDGTTPVFCFETKPSELSLKWLAKKGVRTIVGTPEEVASKIDVLSQLK